jgi:hypothetical protein
MAPEPKTAKDAITVENAIGQTVVVVPAGQPIPDNLDELKARYSQTSVLEEATGGDDVADGTEDKARRSSTTSSKRTARK